MHTNYKGQDNLKIPYKKKLGIFCNCKDTHIHKTEFEPGTLV